jgi:hypothetical protein
LIALIACPAIGQATQPAAEPIAEPVPEQNEAPRQPPVGLLTPIPENGNLPPILGMLDGPSESELRFRAAARKYAQQINVIRHKYFGPVRVQRIRDEGISQLREFTDPASFRPLITELAGEQDDVRLALVDHFANQRDMGQAALAWLAIHDDDAAIRHESSKRLHSPATPQVLSVLNSGLRSREDSVATNAAGVAGNLNVLQAIPLLIFAQAIVNTPEQPAGDLAWIAIETQRAYVAGLQPIVGNASGAFQPIIGTVSDGVVMRVVDAVAISYRTEIHTTLVAMTSNDWGQPTSQLGYNIDDWWRWYNTQYVPFKNEQALEASLAVEPPKQ